MGQGYKTVIKCTKTEETTKVTQSDFLILQTKMRPGDRQWFVCSESVAPADSNASNLVMCIPIVRTRITHPGRSEEGEEP